MKRDASTRSALTPALSRGERGKMWPLWVGVAVCVVYLVGVMVRPERSARFDLDAFARTPVSYKGRVKPMDSVARDTLLVLSNRQTLEYDGQEIPAVQWLLDTLVQRPDAARYRVFRIADPRVAEHLELTERTDHRYNVEELAAGRQGLAQLAGSAAHKQAGERDAFERNVMALETNIRTFENLWLELHFIPPQSVEASQDSGGNGNWTTMEEAVQVHQQTGRAPDAAVAWANILKAYQAQDGGAFNREVAAYQRSLDGALPGVMTKASFETFFNRAAPFYHGMVLYVLAGLLACFSWLVAGKSLRSAAVGILIVTLILHTLGLIARVYISGRPPVTNLYSSAVFIGWGTVVACLILERLYRNGIATLLASVAGFVTLIIAHHLARSGDTMAVLVAVLDTNIWLATHVVVVTIGYAATYLAGLLGIVYIVRGLFTTTLTPVENKRMGQMLYGVICFALLFSFVGTVLGGIWADQSWGRFWGWDPKENGAILIVLWNALMLHARWGGMARERGLATLSVFGNIVTSWSWFGTNMLGVGLHAYGFIDSALFWLFFFVLIQLIIINFGAHPVIIWVSFAPHERIVDEFRGLRTRILGHSLMNAFLVFGLELLAISSVRVGASGTKILYLDGILSPEVLAVHGVAIVVVALQGHLLRRCFKNKVFITSVVPTRSH